MEFRTLTLKANSGQGFHKPFTEQGFPLLKLWNFDVVAHGPSLHDEDTYYVIRRFDSFPQHEQREDAYYASDDWRKGPRETMLALTETYADVVFELHEVTVEGLRKSGLAKVSTR